MIGSTRAVGVFAYAAPVDMRKSYEGLSALVRNELRRDIRKRSANRVLPTRRAVPYGLGKCRAQTWEMVVKGWAARRC